MSLNEDLKKGVFVSITKKGTYCRQSGVIDSIESSSSRINAIKTYNVQLQGGAFIGTLPFAYKDLQKINELPELDDNIPNPSKKAKICDHQGDDANSGFDFTSAGGGGGILAQNIVVFDENEQDQEQAVEDNVADEVVDRSGVTDASFPRYSTVKTKTTPVASMTWTETAVVNDPSVSYMYLLPVTT